MVVYNFKTDPYPHQQEEFDYSKDLPIRAIFWEQQTGKTKVIIDTACHLYVNKKIEALFVVAPNGVHRNWVTDELPAHMPDDMLRRARFHFYQSKRASTKWHKLAVKRVTNHHKGLAVLTMTYDAFVTKLGKRAAWDFMKDRPIMYVLDESHRIKTPSAKRTRSIVTSGKFGAYKRILSGTPVAAGPFDVYTPMRFLDGKFWHPHGFYKFETYRYHFGIYKDNPHLTITDRRTGEEKPVAHCVGYHRLEELHDILAPVSSRVTKDNVLPGLPPKVYNKKYFDLTPKQRAVYDEFKEEFIVELDSGLILSEPLALVRLLRLHQITSNYVPTDDEDTEPTVEIDPGNNVRLEALFDLLKDIPRQTIIWARFTRDIDKIIEALEGQAVRYDGQVGEDDRAANKAMFQAGEAKFFVGNAQAGAEGLSLKMAKYVIYYNNSFRLVDRLQSEDRAHGIGQEEQVGYWDIIANDTVDLDIVKNLVKKVNLSNKILGDKFREWL